MRSGSSHLTLRRDKRSRLAGRASGPSIAKPAHSLPGQASTPTSRLFDRAPHPWMRRPGRIALSTHTSGCVPLRQLAQARSACMRDNTSWRGRLIGHGTSLESPSTHGFSGAARPSIRGGPVAANPAAARAQNRSGLGIILTSMRITKHTSRRSPSLQRSMAFSATLAGRAR
jgi:hypothetical protein